METIRNYLETMFMNLPNTAEVRRAKDELWQMMEDKYTELIGEGKTDNEAIGIVISEFGNLEELAEDLGINQVVNHEAEAGENATRRMITMEEAMAYLKAKSANAVTVAIGVMICIFSVTGAMVVDALDLPDAIAGASFFAFVAVAVFCFVLSGMKMTKWEYLKKEPCSMDFATSEKVKSQYDSYMSIYAIIQAMGIILCIVCFIPSIIADEIFVAQKLLENLGYVAMFVILSIGVLLLVYANIKRNGYLTLMGLNDSTTMAGEYTKTKKANRYYPWAQTVLDLFYPTVTCIYFSWSFLTFDWHITWIVWPIAAVLNAFIKLWGKKGE